MRLVCRVNVIALIECVDVEVFTADEIQLTVADDILDFEIGDKKTLPDTNAAQDRTDVVCREQCFGCRLGAGDDKLPAGE